MSDLSQDDEIKQMFVDESLEALQRVERLLLDAEEGHPRADMVDVMFRDMHTIKGTAALLGFERTASLAHAAEDLMSRLRDKSVKARPAHFALMVKVVDGLRQYVEATRDQNSEGALDSTALVEELHRYTEQGDDAVDAASTAAPEKEPEAPAPVVEAAPPPPAPTAPELVRPPPSAPIAAPRASAPPPAPPPPAPSAPPAPAPSAPNAAAAAHGGDQDGTVRVNVGVLDKLMNLMGELVLSRNQMVQLMRGQRDAAAQSAAQRLSLVTSDLQQQIMKTRMQPVSRVFEKIPRQVRDLAQQTGKKVTVDFEGTSTELDKALVEAIRDPLMHIIRNAIDHGIEAPADREARGKNATGRLVVRAVHEGNNVSIEVRDDGKGVDPAIVKRVAVNRGVITQAEADAMRDQEAVELIFRPGFSTAEKVTSLSGRGVGMDVVRTHVERAGGAVEFESELGKGTAIRLRMPLTLAIIPALLVEDGGQRFAVPQANLLELVRLSEAQVASQIEWVRGAPVFRLRGELVPLVRLAPLLGREPAAGKRGLNLVVVQVAHRRYALGVESIHDTEEIVIKPLHAALKRLGAYAGATVLGDGGVALILDVGGIASLAGIDLTGRAEKSNKTEQQGTQDAQSMLIFEMGDGARGAVPVSMVARLEQVERSAIEQVAQGEVLQYRGEIMPLIRPEGAMPVGAAPQGSSVQHLLVFNFGKPIGLAVNAILDATAIDAVHTSDVPHTLGRTVVFGKTTLLVDVFGLVRQLAPAWLEPPRQGRRPRVVLTDGFEAMRGSIAGFLRASGLDVLELSPDAALRELRSGGKAVDAVVASLDPVPRGLELVRTLKAEQPDLPIVCVAPDGCGELATSAGARTCVRQLEREAILHALEGAGIFTSQREAA
ncbi:MAG: hybrid sensor histidine kinase/response regulator [Myxococcaceae bacterium]